MNTLFRTCILLFLLLSVVYSSAQQIQQSNLIEKQFEVKKLNLNTRYEEYGPNVVGDKLYFISNRPVEFGIKHYDKSNGRDLYRINYVPLNGKGQEPDQLIPGFIKKNHEGPFYLNQECDHLWFTGNDTMRKIKGKRPLVIYEAVKINDQWEQKKIKFEEQINGSMCHPFLFDNNTRMVFCANSGENAIGGMDLYVSENVKGVWSNIKNLGPKINSSGNEGYPFIDKDGILYYCSNGKDLTKSDYDIYKINLLDSAAIAIKMGEPVNSDFNETGYYFDSETQSGYFSSNRDGNDDIFSLKFTWPNRNNCDSLSVKKYCYEFSEESSLGMDDTLQMANEWDFGDGTKTRGLIVEHCYQDVGAYEVSLNVIDKTTGITILNQVKYSLEIEDSFPVKRNIIDNLLSFKPKSYIDSITKVFLEIDGNPYYVGNDTCVVLSNNWKQIKEIYCYLNDGKNDTICNFIDIPERKARMKKIDTLLHIKDPPDKKFRIHLGSSHFFYNELLNKEKFSDTLTMENDSDGLIHYYLGNYTDIDSAYSNFKHVRKNGMNEATLIAFEDDKSIEGQSLLGNLDSYFEMEGYKRYFTFYYDYSSYVISEIDRGKLLKLFAEDDKWEGGTFKVSSYTDPSGTSEYNKKLSIKRTNSVKLLLESLRVPRENILQTKVSIEGDQAEEFLNLNDSKLLRRTDVYIRYEK